MKFCLLYCAESFGLSLKYFVEQIEESVLPPENLNLAAAGAMIPLRDERGLVVLCQTGSHALNRINKALFEFLFMIFFVCLVQVLTLSTSCASFKVVVLAELTYKAQNTNKQKGHSSRSL